MLEDAGKQQGESSGAPLSGCRLLEHAQRSMDESYLVNSTKPLSGSSKQRGPSCQGRGRHAKAESRA